MIPALFRRLRRHGRDGQIPHLIEMAWTHARHGRWDDVERAVHALQTRHPTAIVALIHTATDRALTAHPDLADHLLDDLHTVDGSAAWLVAARWWGEHRAVHLEITRRGDEGQRDLAVAVLRYATRQEVTR